MTYSDTVRRIAIVLTAAVSVTAPAACGGKPASNDGAKQQDVATIVGTKGASASASTAAAERPLIRPDMSADDIEHLYQLYYDCGKANGAKMVTEHGKEIVDKTAPGNAQVMEKCADKFPEELAERAQRTDPLYDDKLRAWVKCVQSHGVKAKVVGKNLAFDGGLPSAAGQKFVDQCELDAFVKG